MLRKEIQRVLDSQAGYFTARSGLVDRDLLASIQPAKGFVTVITGVRRSGKSTLLQALIHNQTQKKTQRRKAQYLHFDDPRLISFNLEDFYTVEEICGKHVSYYFDELHQVPQWERYIRQANDRKLPLTITGSNASMLSGELATLLTGRHLRYELFPFSFSEYAVYKKRKLTVKLFEQYISEGGFPEFLRYKNREIHRQLLLDIIDRDIVARYGIRDRYAFMQLALHLMHNVSRPFTHRKLARSYDLGSVNTVTSYINYLENAYLFFSIYKYDHSYRKQQANEKKIYAIDTGFVISTTTKLQDDQGRLFENVVFLHLRRKYRQIHYYKNKGECDFIVSEHGRPVACYQVCVELNRHNMDRELNGLIEAMSDLSVPDGFIITLADNDRITKDGHAISIMGAVDFMR